MSGFINEFPNINRYTFYYLTAEDIDMVSMPFYYASNRDLCHSLPKQCEVFKNETILTSITFSELEDKWNYTLGIEFNQLPRPKNTEVKTLFVKLTYKQSLLLTNNVSVTKYLSHIQCSTLFTHINNVIKGGVTDLAIPNVVGAKKIPPSFSVIHSLSDGFSIVLFSNTHNIQREPYLVHQSMGIRLVLKLGMSLIWNGFLLQCGG